LTEDSPESFSPAGERVRYMALSASSSFDKVYVLALGRSKKFHAQKGDSKVLLYEVNWWRGLPYPISAFFDPVKALLLFVFGLSLSLRVEFRYVLVSMPPVEVGLVGWLLAKLSGKNLVVDLRDDWESSMEANVTRYIPMKMIKPLFKLARQIYSSSTNIFAATQTIADTLRTREINTSIRYVPNGADTMIFFPQNKYVRVKTRRKYRLPLEKIAIVYCGSGINPYYRLEEVLKSIRALPKSVKEKVFFLFYVYNGMNRLKTLKEDLEVPNYLAEIHGPMPRRNLAEVLAACDVGLVPFDDKPYLLCARSTKLYEYLSCGTCVICSGPPYGELDVLLSSHPYLGLFTQPTIEGYVKALSQIVKNQESFLSDDMKNLRHQFIKDNFDRRKIMLKAMQALLD